MFGEDSVPMQPLTWAFLMNSARAELVAEVVRPALERGNVVISDRYWYSTMAYQSGGDLLDSDVVTELSRIATGGLEADLVVLLDLPVADGLERKIGGVMNQLDRRPHDFHERARLAYAAMAAADPDRWMIVDAARPPSETAGRVLERTSAVLESKMATAVGR
jgi:dTMP kinase